jgi:hypothetical protein
MPGVARVANVTYLTMQVSAQGDGRQRDVRAMVVGVTPDGAGHPGQPGYLVQVVLKQPTTLKTLVGSSSTTCQHLLWKRSLNSQVRPSTLIRSWPWLWATSVSKATCLKCCATFVITVTE